MVSADRRLRAPVGGRSKKWVPCLAWDGTGTDAPVVVLFDVPPWDFAHLGLLDPSPDPPPPPTRVICIRVVFRVEIEGRFAGRPR